jgi:pyruvate kinase
MPVIALCSTKDICQRLSIMWGVEPELVPPLLGTAHLVKLSGEAVAKILKAEPDDVLTIVAGTPFNVPGKTNLIKVETVATALKAEPGNTEE